MYDTVISKPSEVGGYNNHHLVEALTNGARPLFVDQGDKLVVRTATPIGDSAPITPPSVGDVIGISVRAIACRKVKGQRRWFARGDWKAKHEWLKARLHGAELLSVRSASVKLAGKPGSQDRNINATDFVAIVKITDADAFADVLERGIGGGKIFGAGLVRI